MGDLVASSFPLVWYGLWWYEGTRDPIVEILCIQLFIWPRPYVLCLRMYF